MDSNFDSYVSNDTLQIDVWNTLPLISPINPHEQYNASDLSPNTPEMASSDTRKLTTPVSLSGSTIQHIPASVSSSTSMTHFQNKNTSAQEMANNGDCKREANQYWRADGGGISPVAKLNGRNMTVQMNRGFDYNKLTSPSQVGKVDGYPGLTSIGTGTRTLDSFDKERFGSSCLSLRERLLLEIRSRTSGWPCHICHQRFKRRDYIRQHAKKKHPEYFEEPNSAQDQPLATPASSRPTPDLPLSFGLCEGEQSRYPIVPCDAQLTRKTSNSLQSGAFPGGDTTSQEISLDPNFPSGRSVLDGPENDSSTRLKPRHENSVRFFACPFYKHFPLQHQKCFALSLRRPKDVKQHIHRSHTKPEFFFAMTEDQKKLLNENLPRDLGVEDQWFQIYAIIFPVSELPRSPYVGGLLEEIVPLLRQEWKAKCYEITAQSVGILNHDQLSIAMDLFFRTLEGEALHGITNNSI